jgi:hypothetical protein
MKKASKTKTPRNFLLLDALNKASNYTHVTYGLIDEIENDENLINNYAKMQHWYYTIVCEDDEMTVLEGKCECTMNYPNERPILYFSKESMQNKKVKKICDQDGTLNENTKKMVKWDENMSLGDYLSAVQNIISK